MAELGCWVWCLRVPAVLVILWGLATLLVERGYHGRH